MMDEHLFDSELTRIQLRRAIADTTSKNSYVQNMPQSRYNLVDGSALWSDGVKNTDKRDGGDIKFLPGPFS